jgi:multiple sugar transport system substrate-binding protein/raffinose/stachyose/melibiose transport system substrate-binding protein
MAAKLMKKLAQGALLAAASQAIALGAGAAWVQAAEVVVWGWQQNADLWKDVEKALQAQGEDVTIQYRASDPQQYGAILQSALTGGGGPDVFAIGASAPAPYKFIAAGQLEPLDSIIDPSLIDEKYFDFSTADGVNYGVPFALLTIQWYYNKDMFAEAGLEPPKTWDDLVKVAEALKAKGIIPIAAMGQGAYGQASINWSAEALSASLLGREFIADIVDRKKNFTDERFVTFLTKLKELTNYYQPNWQASGSSGTEMQTLFTTDQAAMTVSGLWDVALNFNKMNPDLNVGSFLTPTLTAGETPYIDYIIDGVFSMRSGIDDPAERKSTEAVIKFTATKEFGDMYAKANSAISPIAGVVNPDEHPVVSQSRDWLTCCGAPDLLGTGSPFMEPPLSTGSDVAAYDSVQSVAWTVLPPMMRGEITPEQAAQQFQERLSWYFDQK